MDAINSLGAGTRRSEALVDSAAEQLAAAGLPTAPESGAAPTRSQPAGSPRANDVDVAGQLVTMTLAADVHHVTTAALRAAFSLYRDSLELLGPEVPADPSRLDT